jgi:hypothetical protein
MGYINQTQHKPSATAKKTLNYWNSTRTRLCTRELSRLKLSLERSNTPYGANTHTKKQICSKLKLHLTALQSLDSARRQQLPRVKRRPGNTSVKKNRGETLFYAVRAEQKHGNIGSLLPGNAAVNLHPHQWETVFSVGSVQRSYLKNDRR